MSTPTCNECGSPATYHVPGWWDEDGYGEEDSYWCEEHREMASQAEPIQPPDRKIT